MGCEESHIIDIAITIAIFRDVNIASLLENLWAT